MIPGIVLAAGASSRMGRPKALLQASGQSFVAGVIQTLLGAGAQPVVAVIRPGADAIATEIRRSGATPVINPFPDEGQLSSLLAGLDSVQRLEPAAVLVTLVDVPAVRCATIRTLLGRLSGSPAAILRATYHGRHGHPVVFRRSVFEALRRADPGAGAKAVLRAHPVEDVEVEDPGVVDDIDTPEDYDRAFGIKS